MAGNAISRRTLLGAAATAAAGSALLTAPTGVWARHADDSIGATNIITFLDIVDRAMNQGDLTALDEHISPKLVDHQIYGMNWPKGNAGIRAAVTTLRAAFPDLHSQVIDVASAGCKVLGRAITTGTFTGNYLGIPGNGRKIYIETHDVFLFETHCGMPASSRPQVIEHWGVSDNLTLLLELGLIPAASLPSYKG